MARTLITMPDRARRGQVIEIRALIAHVMETGFRHGPDGRPIARNIIQRFSCSYNGDLVFAAELFPATAANPYIAFHTVATQSGTLVFRWEGDEGFAQSEEKSLTVSA